MKETCPKCKAEQFSYSPNGNGRYCFRCDFRWSINPYTEYGYLGKDVSCGAGLHKNFEEAVRCGNHNS